MDVLIDIRTSGGTMPREFREDCGLLDGSRELGIITVALLPELSLVGES